MDSISGSTLIIGKGGFGVVTSDLGSDTCRKIVTRDKALSLIREAYTIKTLASINGIVEMIGLDHPNNNDFICINTSKKQVTYEVISTKSRRDRIKSMPSTSRKLYRMTTLIPWGVLVLKRYHCNLVQWIRTNPNYDDRFRVFSEIVRIMASVHNKGIIHADLKLENIMLTDTGDVKIIDWGLSGSCGYACINSTTKIYRPKSVVHDYCHDIYSLGVIAIELLSNSLVVSQLDNKACIHLIKSMKLPSSVKNILVQMINPECEVRPTMIKIAETLNITNIVNFDEDPYIPIEIPSKYGLISDSYPECFAEFLLTYPEKSETLFGIMGAIYHSNKLILPYITYKDVIDFINNLT